MSILWVEPADEVATRYGLSIVRKTLPSDWKQRPWASLFLRECKTHLLTFSEHQAQPARCKHSLQVVYVTQWFILSSKLRGIVMSDRWASTHSHSAINKSSTTRFIFSHKFTKDSLSVTNVCCYSWNIGKGSKRLTRVCPIPNFFSSSFPAEHGGTVCFINIKNLIVIDKFRRPLSVLNIKIKTWQTIGWETKDRPNLSTVLQEVIWV